jgi:hypothetical protein
MAGITPWPGGVVDPQNPSYTPAKGFSITQAGTYTVYAEVHAASLHICDYDVIVELRTPESTTSNGQYDQVNVTAIWATTKKVVTDQVEHEILLVDDWSDGELSGKVIYHQLPTPPGVPTPALPAELEIGDYIVIHDDNWTSLVNGVWEETGYRWEIYDQEVYKSNEDQNKHRLGRQWVFARVNSVQSDGGMRISFPLEEGPYYGHSEMITKYDRFSYCLNKHVHSDASWLHKIWCVLGACRLGSYSANDQYRPTSANGIEFQFLVSPDKIFEKPMSNEKLVAVDTARQMHGGSFMEIFELILQQGNHPQQDELPNDAGQNVDCDFVVPRLNNIITVVDGPRVEGKHIDENQENRFGTTFFLHPATQEVIFVRQDLDFKEFVRIGLLGEEVNKDYPGDIVWGSRASPKVRWYSKHSMIPDESRPVVDGQLYYSRKRDNWENEIGLGPYPYGAFFDTKWPGRHDN